MGLHETLLRRFSRRAFMRAGVYGAGMVGIGLWGCKDSSSTTMTAPTGGADTFGPLEAPDANGLMLPPGFTSRVVATSTQEVGKSGYSWHAYPDGGALYGASDGGWIYASNSELSSGQGGVGALRFDADGNVVDAYSILTGTSKNCAGGPTPEGRWLSCEEFDAGRVWDCDPYTPGSEGVPRPAMGIFKHEAVAVDPIRKVYYLTEDQSDGLFYRFTPTTYPDLSQGLLEVATIEGEGDIVPGEVRALSWTPVVNAAPPRGGVQKSRHRTVAERATRYQVASATIFRGGEGCWYAHDMCYFTTKKDNRVWAVDSVANTIEILYDRATAPNPELSGVDNVTVSSVGDVYVAEDGGNMQLIALTAGGEVKPVVEIPQQGFSEIAGPVLTPDGQRLYFSSQRGPTPSGNLGITYEVRGPFTG